MLCNIKFTLLFPPLKILLCHPLPFSGVTDKLTYKLTLILQNYTLSTFDTNFSL